MPGSTLKIRPTDDRHKKICRMLETRIRMAETEQRKQHTVWQAAEDAILAYVPETEMDRQRKNRRDTQGSVSYTTMYIPYTYALLMSAHTYWTSVFFARSPVHQFAGRHGEGENQVQALEAMIAYNTDVGGMMGPYYIWLYDIGKYGVGILGEYWDKELIQRSWIEEGEGGRLQQTAELVGYEGNRIYNIAPWDFLPDPRQTIGNYQKGEFVGVKRNFTWNDLVRRERQGYLTNLDFVKTSRGTLEPSSRDDDQSSLERPLIDAAVSNGDTMQDETHPAIVAGYEVYVDLIQKDWGLGNAEYPEKWVFTITKDKSLLLGAQPLGSLHGRFPFTVGECEVEGYGAWNRGIPQTVEPIQQTMDWLLNVHFFNVRASLNNLFIADPTKIVMKDLMSPSPGGVIRLKPEAYGTDIKQFFQQIPIQDITRANISDIDLMLGIGERTTGISDQIMGVLNTTGRKTATEVRTSTGFGINRQKTITEYLSATAFAPHAQRLVMNCQQYYNGQQKLRLVGSLAQEAGPAFINVTPDSISGFYDFIPVDGTLPVDRMAQVNMWTQLLQGLRQMPQVFQTYDPAKIFSWIATLAGIKNLNQFRIAPVMQPDAVLAAEAQKGNVVPIRQTNPASAGIAPPEQGLL